MLPPGAAKEMFTHSTLSGIDIITSIKLNVVSLIVNAGGSIQILCALIPHCWYCPPPGQTKSFSCNNNPVFPPFLNDSAPWMWMRGIAALQKIWIDTMFSSFSQMFLKFRLTSFNLFQFRFRSGCLKQNQTLTLCEMEAGCSCFDAHVLDFSTLFPSWKSVFALKTIMILSLTPRKDQPNHHTVDSRALKVCSATFSQTLDERFNELLTPR